MRSRLLDCLLLAALTLCAFLPVLPAQAAATAPAYSVVDLGTLGGSNSYAMGINTRGDVVGDSWTAAGVRHAFLYKDGAMSDLGTLGGAESRAFAINDAGQIVGESTTTKGETHAFLWSGGAMIDLGTLGGTFSSAASINASGDVVGTSTIANEDRHAFVYSGGAIKDLGTFGALHTTAAAINDAGDIVGTWTKAGGEFGSFLYSAGSAVILDALRASAKDVNSSRQITGAMPTPLATAQHAFMYSNGVTTDLGTLDAASFGTALNDAGQVVGYNLNTQGGAGNAFVSEGGVMRDLRALIPPDSGWLSLVNAMDVNAAGQIAGSGYRYGEFRAFLLTPLPVVVLSSKPADPSASASARFVFASDPGNSFECKLDDRAYTACSSPQIYGSMTNGTHTFSVRATDARGNVGPAETYGWTVAAPPSPPVASIPAKDRLLAARDALEAKKALLPAATQMYVQFAIDSVNRALDPSRWTSVGLRLNDQSRDTLLELRMATGWLYWADPDVRAATAAQQTEIIRAMGEIVRQRFNEVFHFIGEGGSASPWVLWASEYLMNEGDRLIADGWELSASLSYATAWDYLLHESPCC